MSAPYFWWLCCVPPTSTGVCDVWPAYRSRIPAPAPTAPAGISHDPARFQAAADRCLAEFSALFGGSPLVLRRLPPDYGPPPNCRWWPWLDCMYT